MVKLKELREEKNWSQQKLAMELNVSQSTISFYETGERFPDLKALIRLANLFDVSIDYLVGYSDIKSSFSLESLTQLESNILIDLKKLHNRKQEQVGAFIKGLLFS